MGVFRQVAALVGVCAPRALCRPFSSSVSSSLFRPTCLLLAGHSKWKNIKHRKEASDAKRSQLFSKISIEIIAAVREGGGDAASNTRLAGALSRARENNMPKDNIEKAVKRGLGVDKEGTVWESLLYEGYGPHGIAVIVEALTDNRNRTAPKLRSNFSKSGGSLGSSGSVSWMFSRVGLFNLADAADKLRACKSSPDAVMEVAVSHGATYFDHDENEDLLEVRCEVPHFGPLRKALLDFCPEFSGAVAYVPTNYAALPSEDAQLEFERFLELLDDNEDVQNYYHNAE